MMHNNKNCSGFLQVLRKTLISRQDSKPQPSHANQNMLLLYISVHKWIGKITVLFNHVSTYCYSLGESTGVVRVC